MIFISSLRQVFCQFSGEVFKKLLMFKLSCINDKTNKMAWAPSLIRVFAVCFMGSWRPYPSSCKQQRLIRLGRCPSWSESSLDAHTILLVLSRCDSIIIFICMCLVSMFWAYLIFLVPFLVPNVCCGSNYDGLMCCEGYKKKCLINYYSLMCFSLSKVPCVSCVMLIWYFLLF